MKQSEKNGWRGALAGAGRRQVAAGEERQGFRHQHQIHDRRQENYPGQAGTEVVDGQTEFTGMVWQNSFFPYGVFDRMHPGCQLGQDQSNNKQDMT